MMSSNKRKRRDRSPSLSNDSKENIDFDEDDDDSQPLHADAHHSDDSLDMDISPIAETGFLNTQDNSNFIECGVVKSLKLVNFMCHGHFAIDFGPRINFVVGRNGSKLIHIFNDFSQLLLISCNLFFFTYLLFFILPIGLIL